MEYSLVISALLYRVIEFCRQQGYPHTTSYLEHAGGDMFIALENRLNGKTTSKFERPMRTVNMRAKASKWSTEGALDGSKVRLACSDKGFDAYLRPNEARPHPRQPLARL